MAPFLRRVTGKACTYENCSRRGHHVDVSQTHCEECNRPLMPVISPKLLNRVLGVLLTSGVLAGSAFEAVKYFRPQVLDVRVLPARAEAETRLSAADAKRLLATKLRATYRDCKAGADEQAEIEKLLASDPELPRAYSELEQAQLSHMLESCRLVRTGQTLVAQKLYGHAQADFLKATEEDPENANAWAALGAADMLAQREEEAKQAYEQALAVDPESWIAHYNYGFYFARKGETEAAFLHLDQALALLKKAGNVDRAALLEDLRKNPILDPLRLDPRFTRLLG